MKASKNDKTDNKIPLEFLELDGIAEMCKVFAFGAEKYSAGNYFLGHEQTRLLAAAMRHLLAYQGGEDLDPESGLTHLGHAQCCLAMLQKQKALGTSIDDRITLDKVRGEGEADEPRLKIGELYLVESIDESGFDYDISSAKGKVFEVSEIQELSIGVYYKMSEFGEHKDPDFFWATEKQLNYLYLEKKELR
jgi:hypothetical protein